MKKYFLMLATFAATALMVSCGGEKPQPEGPTGEVKLTEATYYGEKLAAKTGFYSVTLTKGDDKIRLDLIATLSEDVNKAKLPGGEYTKGTKETPTLKTYFVATETTDAEGTLYWSNGTPALVTAGDISVSSSASGYRIALKLVAGGKNVEWIFNGTIAFENKSEIAPRVPIEAGNFAFLYIGEYVKSTEQLGAVSLILASKEQPNLRIQMNLTVPFPADADKVAMPLGTFEVNANPNAANQVIPGKIGDDFSSYEYTMNSVGKATGGVLIDGGTLTVSKSGDAYTIETNFTGNMFDSKNQLLGRVEDVIWTLTTSDFPEYANDKTRPMSTLDADLPLASTLTEAFVDQWEMAEGTTKYMLTRLVLYEETVGINPSNKDYAQYGTLYVNGEGNTVILQYVTKSAEAFPVGTFPVGKVFDPYLPKPSTGFAGAANIQAEESDLLGLGSGCWYIKIGIVEDVVMSTGGAGAMPDKGFVTVAELEKSMQFEFEFFDKNEHKVSGIYNGTPITPASASYATTMRANTFGYTPSFGVRTSTISLSQPGKLISK